MPEISSSSFSETDANNNNAPPNGFPEGMAFSGVNDSARAVMAALKRFWNRIQGGYASTNVGNAYSLDYTMDLAVYVTGERYSFRANAANTGAATLNIDGLGGKAIKKMTAAGKADITAGDIQSGQPVTVEYDGTDMVMVTPAANSASLADVAAAMPTGVIVPYAGSSTPTGWLRCDGQAVSRTTYAALFAALGSGGSPYGLGDGSTTFNVPDLRGRVVAGEDQGNATGRLAGGVSGSVNAGTRGNVGGTEAHVLTVAQLPTHTHTFSVTKGLGDSGLDENRLRVGGTTSGTAYAGTTDGAGSGTTHNNVQPTIVLIYIIKT